MRRLLTTLFIIIIFFGVNSLVKAAAQVQIRNASVEYTFGGQITFRAEISADKSFDNVFLFLQSENDTIEIIEFSQINAPDEYIHIVDLNERPLRVFSQHTYWYQVIFDDGEEYISPVYDFYYEDNRFQWRSLESGIFQLYWYEGELDFAQSIINIALEGLSKIREYFDAPNPDSIRIYTYASALEMQATLRLAGQTWVAGHANPDLQVILVSLPPGPDQSLEIRRQIPHELTHVMLYQAIGPAYENIPHWLNEGLASIVELFPNPDYQLLLETSYQKESLLPIADLCDSFPLEASSFLLAYAESTDFTRYLTQQFGKTGIQDLIQVYAQGMSCERGTEVALGVPLQQLERGWREERFNENAAQNAFGQLFPWTILIIAVMLAPIILSITKWERDGNNKSRPLQGR